MPVYRLYCVNSEGHVTKRHDVDCATDSEALRRAHEYCKDSDIEVWLLDRRVHRVLKGSKLPPTQAG